MFEITGRVTRGVNEYAVVLRKMALKPFVRVTLSKGTTEVTKAWARGMVFRDPYLDYRITVNLENEEFKATFLDLLDYYTHQAWDQRSELTRQSIQCFYKLIQRLDSIYSEFKAQTQLSAYPKNIIVVKTDSLVREYTDGTVEYWGGEYFPVQHSHFKLLEDYGIEFGAHDVAIYAEKSSLEAEALFIHELVHHLMDIEGLERTENSVKMLEVLRKHMPKSWLTARFEYVKEKTEG